MLKNTANQKLYVRAVDVTTGLPKTGDAANLTAYVAKDYGSVTVLADTSATEIDSTNAKGYYVFDLSQAETNADQLLFTCKSGTANIVVVACPDSVQTVVSLATLAAAILDLANGIETGLTPRQAFRLIAAVAAGKYSGANTATHVIRNAVADSKARITATVDASGRTAVTTDVT